MKCIQVDDDWFGEAVAESLLWGAENAEKPQVRKSCLEAAFYYMTLEQIALYLGSIEEAEDYWYEL